MDTTKMKTRIRQLTEQEKRSAGEQQMIADWLQIFPSGILSMVSDTFDLWKLITEYLPANKEAIMARDGKLVIRPDSGDPVDIICGYLIVDHKDGLVTARGANNTWKKSFNVNSSEIEEYKKLPECKGVIELLWDIFGGTINEQGYKVLDPHIGAIYGDSITPERQVQIYERLAAKGFAATNIVLGVGSFSYTGGNTTQGNQYWVTRDLLGFAAKGSWFEVEEEELSSNGDGTFFPHKVKTTYNIYKDPITDDGTKKSLKGLQMVGYSEKNSNEIITVECNQEYENKGLLQVIYEDGKFYNQTTLEEVRNKLLQCQ